MYRILISESEPKDPSEASLYPFILCFNESTVNFEVIPFSDYKTHTCDLPSTAVAIKTLHVFNQNNPSGYFASVFQSAQGNSLDPIPDEAPDLVDMAQYVKSIIPPEKFKEPPKDDGIDDINIHIL
jgi:hypothetical protein